MKLSRNKIRKIRKQQHQSVRKWKKQHRSSARRTTFRQSRRQNMSGIITNYPSKLNNVVNRTLKKYIPLQELEKIKEKYKKLRRMRRKQNHYKMIGGKDDDAPAKSLSPDVMNTLIQTVVTSAITAALNAKSDANPPAGIVAVPEKANNDVNNQPKAATSGAETASENAGAQREGGDVNVDAKAADIADTADTADTADKTGTVSGTSPKDGKNQPFSLGPEIKGDISIGMETHECKNQNEVWKLVQFLIRNGLPYYIQIELKSGDKPLNKNDTNIFDLRRILYGKFTQDIKKIPGNKRQLYIEAKETVGIANGDTFGVEQPGQYIYTGEKGQILEDSTDSSIKVRILQEDKAAAPSILTDSKRLYKIKGKEANVKPASIDTVAFLQKIDSKNRIDTSEFKLQIAPMTPEELNKDAENVATGNDNPEAKVVVDESNTYVVNLDVGCKITSIQTLKKSLERARASLENEKDTSKKSAMDILKMLNALLQNPEFAKNAGYADFKDMVYGFSYKIRGFERKYGLAQMQTFFDDKEENIPPGVLKEFLKLMKLLGHGPNGSNGECERFDGTSQSVYELSRIQTFEEDGKIVTKKTDTLDSALNLSGFAKQLSKLGQAPSGEKNENEENKQEGSPSSATENKTESTGVEAATAIAGEGADQSSNLAPSTPLEETDTAAVASSTAVKNSNLLPLTKDQIKEIDAIDSNNVAYKGYLIRQFKFDGGLPSMNLVHFMGWGKGYDEYIPESEASTRIFERGKYDKQPAPITGQDKGRDDTLDMVMKLYENDDMAKLEETAKKKAQKYNDRNNHNSKLSSEVAAMAAAAAVTSAASAASAAVQKVA